MGQRNIRAFLEGAFESVLRPPSSAVGRATVEPSDDAILVENERTGLAEGLIRLTHNERAKRINLAPLGHCVTPSDDYPLLKKYLQAVHLYQEAAIGSWVQVGPAGGFMGH
jgi:hypothetical protein